MRCSSCNKFVSSETNEPEVNTLEVDNEGVVTGNVRVVDVCQECSTELREANLDVGTVVLGVEEHMKEFPDHEISVDADLSPSERTEGKGMRVRTFHGAEGMITVTCSCGAVFTVEWGDDCQVSAMDQL